MRSILCVFFLSFLITFPIKSQSQQTKDDYRKIINDYKKSLDQIENDSIKALTCIRLSIGYRKVHLLDSSVYFAVSGKKIAIENDIDYLISQALIAEGNTYIRKTEYVIGKIKLDSAIYFAKKSTDTLGLAAAYVSVGSVLFQVNELNNALKYYLDGLMIAKETTRTDMVMTIYYNIALIYLQLKNNEKSLEYLNKMKEISITKGYNNFDLYINHLMGTNFFQLKNYSKAKDYHNKTLQNAIRLEDERMQITTYMNLGELQLIERKFVDAGNSYRKALQIHQTLGVNLEELSSIYIGLAEVNFETNNYKNALSFAMKALSFATEQKQTEFQRDAYELLAKISETTKSYHSSIDYLKKARELSDSLYNEGMMHDIAELETKYQTQQKENEILRLNIDNEKNKTQLAQSRLINISGAGVLVLVLGIGFFFWQRKKQQLKLALLENSIQATELEKKRIGKELHDGIAGTLIKLVKDVEHKDLQLSDQLLGTYNEVRKISHQLDNSPSHGEVFMERLIDLVPQDKDDRHFSFQINPVSLEINEPIATHLYRIIQELIANNLKYSQANNTKIHLKLEDHVLNLHYEDNGVGIQNLKKGNGFKNMEDRLELIHGEMKIFKEVSIGLKIEIIIPNIYEKKGNTHY